jgi:hypothetical protein
MPLSFLFSFLPSDSKSGEEGVKEEIDERWLAE